MATNNYLNRDEFFMNRSTGEITYSKTEAMEWYRKGDEVGLWIHSERFGDREIGYWEH